MTRSSFAALAVLAAASAPAAAAAQGAAPAAGPAPSVYIQEAVLGAQPGGQQRAARSGCTVTALARQWCGTAASCDIGSRPQGNQQPFFVARQADIAQVCNIPLAQATELRVTYRCRYGQQVDGTIIQEVRAIALEDSGAALGRSAFRIVMACH